MKSRIPLLAPAVLAILAVVPAAAQTRDTPGRFTMQPIEGGFLRLDTQSGAVSTCRAGSGNVVLCQPAQEEQAALAKEIERLRAENTALKAEMARQHPTTPGAPGQPPLAGPPATQPPVAAPPITGPPVTEHDKEKFQLPSEEDVDHALDYVERMFKKFRDRLRNLEEDNKGSGSL